MKLGTRIFFSCLAVVCLCLYYPLNRMADTIMTHYREGVEDILADHANILAGVVEDEIREQRFSAERWQELFSRTHGRTLSARIYGLDKDRVDSQVYITDNTGTVLFDSDDPANVGKDYSEWRDVFLTLQGQYGARTSRREKDEDGTSVMYVAAPIYAGNTLAGVLTVAKPTTNIRYFVDGARLNILRSGVFSLAAAGVLSLLVTLWLTRPIKRLTRYARSIRDGGHPEFPKLDGSEIGELGKALSEMQESLEGKRYVERYIEHLTHEIKSPLSAIRGAAELLGEPMEEGQRQRFVANINSQSRRIQEIVDRMLELAALESRSYRRADNPIPLEPLIQGVCQSKEPLMVQRGLSFEVNVPASATVRGDAFLLHQAVSNLVQNAMDFSPDAGCIRIKVRRERDKTLIEVADQGSGIPDYAQKRIFEKFFSLQRPRTGQKGTGLGLNFVQQVALMHGGRAGLENLSEGGCRAWLEI